MSGDEGVVRELASRYVWWESPERALLSRSRFVCQLLQLGTAADVRSGRRILGDEALREALPAAPPGRARCPILGLLAPRPLRKPRAAAPESAPAPLTLTPRLDVLPPAQRALWPELLAVPRRYAASLLHLGGTKMKTLLQRVEAKDYRDIAALLDPRHPPGGHSGSSAVAFRSLLQLAHRAEGAGLLRGGDLDTLGDDLKARLIAESTRDLHVVPPALRSTRLD